MARIGRFTVSAGLLAALLSLPCVCSAVEYEEPAQFCHDMAWAAYDLAAAQGADFPDDTYERVQAKCDHDAYRAHLLADSSVSLNEVIAFDQDGQSFFVEAGWE